MKKSARPAPWFLTAWVAALALVALAPAASAAEHRLGIGAHFWKTVDDLVDDTFSDIEDDGLAYVLSYQYIPRGLLRLEIDLEYYDDGFGGSPEGAISPLAYVLIGRSLYGGVGVGVTFSDGLDDDVSDPYFAARLGYELHLLPGLSVDINANYRADAFNDLDQADTDAITLGALLRFNL